jgi:hypothetical protein
MATKTPGPQGFMRLPPEIRVKVYEYHFSNVLLQSGRFETKKPMLCCRIEPVDHYGKGHMPGILRVSKTVRQEAWPVWMANIEIGIAAGGFDDHPPRIPRYLREAAKVAYLSPNVYL